MEKKFKLFNWGEAKKVRTPEVFSWMFANYYKQVSEDEFVAALDQFRKLRKAHSRPPSYSRRAYRKLQREFGFFL